LASLSRIACQAKRSHFGCGIGELAALQRFVVVDAEVITAHGHGELLGDRMGSVSLRHTFE
jgi:hypothetical protein